MSSVNIKRRLRPGRKATIGIPYVWLVLFFLLPFLVVLKISLAEQDVSIPPFTPLFDQNGSLHIVWQNYKDIFADF